MTVYPELAILVRMAKAGLIAESVVPYLIEVWVSEYCQEVKSCEIVETSQEQCSFLFDISNERLISAWAVSQGASHKKRDASRMRGHPLGYGSRYHRGHAIPHSMGGPADINLVPQLASINIGPFRLLEKKAVATVGSLYFTHWLYGASAAQKPTKVQQGLLQAGVAPEIAVHGNS
jgi:hypothetical protein